MNRLDNLFANKKKDILNVYFTAGHPNLHDTQDIILTLEEAGVDLIELGMPYSDPMADGPVIQRASERALEQGMSLISVLNIVKTFRSRDKTTPIVLMGYLNPIEIMGYENFAEAAQSAGRTCYAA